MNVALTVIALICVVTLPVLIIYLTRINKAIGVIGAVACCYIVGFAFSTIGFTGYGYDKSLISTVAYVLVALSIPLILFSIDLRALKKLTRGTVVGYTLCIVSAIAVAVAAFFITFKFFPSAKLAAMSVGLYTGGTPNLNAIGAGLNAGETTIAAANVSDTIVGGVYFLLLVSVAPRIYSKILDGRKKAVAQPMPQSDDDKKNTAAEGGARRDDYSFGFGIRDWKSILKLVGALALSVGCLGVGALLEYVAEGTVGENLLYILLSVSVLGVALSFIKPIREIKGEYSLGSYLILCFSLALSMSIDWKQLSVEILPTLAFFAGCQLSVIILHALLCKIFRVDAYSAIITSTAGIYGPPFIAPVANACKRQDMIAPGVICGALGLAIGTLLGLGVGKLLLLIA